MRYWDGRRWAPDPATAAKQKPPSNKILPLGTALIILFGLMLAAIPNQSLAGAPNLRVEPASAKPGDRVTVRGEAFVPRANVDLRWRPGDDPVATVQTNPQGSLRARLVVPNLPAGTYSLTATTVDPVAGRVADIAAVAFTVLVSESGAQVATGSTPSPTQGGGGEPNPTPALTPNPTPTTAAPPPAATPPAAPPPAAPPPAPPPPPVADVPGFRFVITIYNDAGANIALGAMRPYLRSGDIFLVLSGNNGNALKPAWVNQVGARLVNGVPGTTVYAATAGIANGAALAAGVTWPVSGVAYVYEPNMANEPEFSWDWATTQAHFQTFAANARARGLLAIGKPTGRPLLEPGKVDYGWSYGTLGRIMDAQTPQFQTWCRQGLYGQALDRAITQYNSAGAAHRWYPEISLDLGSINGVQPQTAIACSRAAVARGLPGALVWWAPPYANQAVAYLAAFRGAR
jgi:hypothetical protein